MPAFLRNLTYEGVPVWRHAHIVQWALQIVSGVAVVALVVWFIANIGVAIDSRNIPFGFGFLDIEYQTPIGEKRHPLRSVEHVLVRPCGGGGEYVGSCRPGRDHSHDSRHHHRRVPVVEQLVSFEAGPGLRGVLPKRAAAGAVAVLVLHRAGAAAGAGRVSFLRLALRQQQRHLYTRAVGYRRI